ncbi:nitrite reductase [Nocardiopsis sp. HNM0947]|uniref:Nitrite reductase n=1 Tax=Nocardiopsis coralli TaxID=2772213 RepID=A0ABR9PEU6_9ACTN|nr:nitrite reductase [Nocardiopsis coralli]MBE3002342.1 nitrite reductase [Nocardiopsis coralli]
MPPTGRPAPGHPGPRERRDRCPGALRPWAAEDGLLVRLRIIGGHLPVESLQALVGAAERYGDGRVHVTVRANLQLRGFPSEEARPDRNEVPGAPAPAASSRLAPEAVDALEATGLLPSRTHELVRNVMVSPGTGLWGGRADLRPVAAELDRLLRAAPHRARLPGRFLFVLDDGRGDLLERTCDLGLVALDEHWAQLRVGDGWGPIVAFEDAAEALVALADRFLELRGDGPSAAWHVTELPDPLTAPVPPDPRSPPPAPPLPYGPVPGGGRHVPVPDAGLDRAAADALAEEARAAGASALVVTPWRGVLVRPADPHAPDPGVHAPGGRP